MYGGLTLWAYIPWPKRAANEPRPLLPPNGWADWEWPGARPLAGHEGGSASNASQSRLSVG